MPVVSFPAAGRGNCVVVAGTAYVYATVAGRGFVMTAQCPHRGGPLHLADVTPDATRLVCPWHERKTSTARLRAAVPAVRTGGLVTAVFRDEQPTRRGAAVVPACSETVHEHRPLSAALSRAAAGSPSGHGPGRGRCNGPEPVGVLPADGPCTAGPARAPRPGPAARDDERGE